MHYKLETQTYSMIFSSEANYFRINPYMILKLPKNLVEIL